MFQQLPVSVLFVTKLLVWLLLLATIFVPLERRFARRRATPARGELPTDLLYFFINGSVPALALGLPLATAGWVGHQLPSAWRIGFAELPWGLRLSITLVVAEVGLYWGHRWCHEVPVLWRFHAVHHSSTHIDWLVNSRGHPVDFIFTRLCGLLPVYCLGLEAPFAGDPGSVPLLIMLLGPAWGFFIHANLKWRFGPLEWLIATPAFHHWHHANEGPATIDKNYAPMFPWVDRVFGTLHLPGHLHPEVYGTDSAVSPGLLRQLLDPMRGAFQRAKPRASSG